MDQFIENITKFIDETPNIYSCISNAASILRENDFIEFAEFEDYKFEKGKKYFITRNKGALIAITIGTEASNGCNIISAHGDSPAFSLKHNYLMKENGYVKINVEKYGGAINYSWFDRPLSVAGIVTLNRSNYLEQKLININKDLLIIPSQAIHINTDVNEKNAINIQKDMLPVLCYGEMDNPIEKIIRETLGDYESQICDFDLRLYNRDNAKTIGIDNESIIAPRLDDLACVYCMVDAIINSSYEKNINIAVIFNSEEVGSMSIDGADSTFLADVMKKIANDIGLDYSKMIDKSFMISADNAHAIHPNASSKSDETNKVYLGGGVTIKHHLNYATDNFSSSIFKEICKKAEVKVQDYSCRSDMRCGSTLGKICISHVPVKTIDIGIPQLAMHSANEMAKCSDIIEMRKAMSEFYITYINRLNRDGVELIRKM